MKSIAVNHIGLTVQEIEKAIEWYGKIFGAKLIIGPLDITPDDSHFGRLAVDLLGGRLRSGKFAHLITENGVGLELFEFDDPEAGSRVDNMEYWKNGIFHFCVTHPEPQTLADEIVANGGKQRTENWEIFPGSERRLIYTEDPWGNIIEIYSHTYEETWSYALQS
ncbi:MAG: VOC family protein [Bacteroidota bacterium]